jgi:two-component system, LytTR family, sensor kinase
MILRILKYSIALTLLWLVPTILFSMQWMIDSEYSTGGGMSIKWSWDPVIRALPRWMVWAPLTPVAIWMARLVERRFGSKSLWIRLLLHIAAIITLAVPATLVWAAGPMTGTSKLPYNVYCALLYPVSLVWTMPLYAAIAAMTYAFDARVSAERLKQQLAEARLSTLHAQLRPHFFFNTLHSIASLIRANRNSEAVSMIARLGELMRESLNDGGLETTVAREMELVRLYLEIQKVRFPDRLKVEFHTEPATMAASIPALLLQPIVENAIDHGIAGLPDGGEIRIASRRENERLVFEIHNTGTLPGAYSEGIGLRNTRERLSQAYGSGQSFVIQSNGNEVSVRIELPW